MTTLQIEYPYAKNVKGDTARFLKRLATPRLRHLTLTYCDFDRECVEALATSPTFANLTRLKIEEGCHANKKLIPKVAERLFRAANLQSLVELEIHGISVWSAPQKLVQLIW